MTKRRPLRSTRSSPHVLNTTSSIDHETSTPKRWHASMFLHPESLSSSPTKQRVARAHEKHITASPLTPAKPSTHQLTLGDRFHALPPELRAHIFALLLVQPVKWEMPHKADCTMRKEASAGAQRPLDPPFDRACASCSPQRADDHRWTQTRGRGTPRGRGRRRGHREAPTHTHTRTAWAAPWRSVWAPPQRNVFLCTYCYDERWRPRPFPRLHDAQPCLCARRAHLQLLLVCRRWYAEGARVLYAGGNTFAFEDPETFVAFEASLAPCWRAALTRVSLLGPGIEFLEESWPSGQNFGRMWAALRRLDALSCVELDARFLDHINAVKGMVRMGLRNVRQVKFVDHQLDHMSWSAEGGDEYLWPQWRHRMMRKGGFAEEAARAIKGERRGWTKKPALIVAAVAQAKTEPITY